MIRLKEYRTGLGITQIELSERSGVPQSVITGIEIGSRGREFESRHSDQNRAYVLNICPIFYGVFMNFTGFSTALFSITIYKTIYSLSVMALRLS